MMMMMTVVPSNINFILFWFLHEETHSVRTKTNTCLILMRFLTRTLRKMQDHVIIAVTSLRSRRRQMSLPDVDVLLLETVRHPGPATRHLRLRSVLLSTSWPNARRVHPTSEVRIYV